MIAAPDVLTRKGAFTSILLRQFRPTNGPSLTILSSLTCLSPHRHSVIKRKSTKLFHCNGCGFVFR